MASNSINLHQQLNIYDRLPDGPYIRVLILEPGRRRQPLRYRLKIVNLEDKPDFEAISYVWGRRIKRKKVLCNGTRIRITANLLQALVAVRLPSRQRTVWADSISINQNDKEEKGRQVALMGPIFNRARRVLIHLAGDDSGHAHGVATFVSEKLALILQSYNEDAEVAPLPSNEMQLLMEDPRIQCVKYLLDHPWFQRGWVIQEAVLAQDAVVIWGSRRISRLDSLIICHSWLFRGEWGMLARRKYNINPILLLSDLYRYRFREVAQGLGYTLGTQPNLIEVLHLARLSKLEDPRDRVYAFLYLDRPEHQLHIAIDAKSRLAIQPDYSKSVAEVYADFAHHMSHFGNIKWLHYVQHTQKSLVARGFASWVPRWDVREHLSLVNRPSSPSIHPSCQIEDSGRQERAIFDGNCLIVSGVVFDRVRACQCYASAASRAITLNDVASFWRMVKTFDFGSAYGPEHLEIALLYTLTQGQWLEPWSEWLQDREMFCQFLRRPEDLETKRSPGTRMLRVEQAILSSTVGRKLIATDRGYFGLAPRIADEDDVCCIIFGCCYPFILREAHHPSVPQRKRYQVVGDAWMAGKQALWNSDGWMFMSGFGTKYNMEWETWALNEGDINLV